MRRLLLPLVGFVLSGCRPDVQIKMLPNEAPAQRTAASFVHCVEAGNSQCVAAGTLLGGWDAFYLLSLLSHGTPVSILEAIPTELTRHRDARLVQARFVEEVERYANSIRGGDCKAAGLTEFRPLIDRASTAARARLESLGLYDTGMAEVISGLSAEAHEDLDGGALVRMECKYDPYRLYVASLERDDLHEVVGLTTLMPVELGGDVPSRDIVAERLRSKTLGLAGTSAPIAVDTISPWLPFPVEVF